ncbi:MAG: ATP-dependent Clp protease ATP-binding subunit [Clostridia bacterium]|nr:ATP-dependent Clp protease ATP-binding subunit [Clostridia bacterium]MBN2883190.1 ATP-dependent Clp protease ATP-binding subunit [Clostridia bacterium]
MKLCDICHKNVAVIYTSQVIDGQKVNKAICMDCARKRGIEPLSQLMKQSGMTDADMDNLNQQMMEIMNNVDMDDMALPNSEGEEIDKQANPLTEMFNSFKKSRGELKNGSDDGSESKNKRDTRLKNNNLKKPKYLDKFGTNLIDRANEGKIDRVIGRNEEINRTVQILNRRTKNNPCLIGEAGVGKTAIAEGLALRIAEGKVPAKLLNYVVYQLDMTGIVAGTQFRGQFESRMKGIIKEASDMGNVILVIDEVHNIVGAGEAEGAMNAANILKPALSKGEIQIIGATTIKEYRRFIEKDSALERRFQPIMVDEPSVAETIEILEGIKPYYEKHHNVRYSEEIIKQSAVLAERYINDRFLPDKAIDVIDEAGAKVNLDNEILVKLQLLKNELDEVRNDKADAVNEDSIDEYKKAADLKIRECRIIEDIEKYEELAKPRDVVFEDIARVIETWTKIPVQRITDIEAKKLLDLEERLAKRIISQKEAIKAVSKAIRRNRSGIRPRKRPSSFVFVGPTGVGKTELVKALAIELFESEEAIIRLDMSEYMERHTVAKLIGSPPGYVGYDEGGQLTEKVRRTPYSVILFDEIEKAHPDVFNILLQILEDGRLSDSHGRVVSFENTIVIMTSNSGTSYKGKSFGFGEDDYSKLEEGVTQSLKEIFRPEFLNRVDETVVFHSLGRDDLTKIIHLMVNQFVEEIKEKHITLEVTDDAVNMILDMEYDEKFGARPLRRGVQKYIEDVLSEKYIQRELKDGNSVKVDYIDGQFTYKIS